MPLKFYAIFKYKWVELQAGFGNTYFITFLLEQVFYWSNAMSQRPYMCKANEKDEKKVKNYSNAAKFLVYKH